MASGSRRACTAANIWASSARPSSSAPMDASPKSGARSKFPDTPRPCSRRRRRFEGSRRAGPRLERRNHALRGPLQFDAAPGPGAMRDGVGTAEQFIDADAVEMRSLAVFHIHERKKKAETLASCILSEEQGDRNQHPKPR